MSCSLTILEKIRNFAAGNYEPVLVADRGMGSKLWDADGNAYFDLSGAYAVLNIGHCHPRVVDAAKAQLDKLAMVSRVTPTKEFAEFCEKLIQFCGLKAGGKVLPALGGHEAVEKAIKIVRKWGYKIKNIEENKAEIIACHRSFHGRTYGTLSLMSNEEYKRDFGPFLPGFVHIPFGDTQALKEAANRNTVAFFVEPIQGEGGVIVPPEGYLQEVSSFCAKNNILLVLDEIQTGFGRTGWELAYFRDQLIGTKELWEPDLIIVGKGLGGGIQPVSAVVGQGDIMDVIKKGDDGSTFAGNPLGCAVALEAMRILREENLCRNAKEVGNYFISMLREIKSSYIKEVRGRGLMIGVEVINEDIASRIQSVLLSEHIFIATSRNVLRFSPPLNISKYEIDSALTIIEKVLKGRDNA